MTLRKPGHVQVSTLSCHFAGALGFIFDMGINIKPFLAVGGVSGVALGLGAQSFMSSVIAGMNLVSCFALRRWFPLRSCFEGPSVSQPLMALCWFLQMLVLSDPQQPLLCGRSHRTSHNIWCGSTGATLGSG